MHVEELEKYFTDIENRQSKEVRSNWVTNTNQALSIVNQYPANWDKLSTKEKASWITDKWTFSSEEAKSKVVQFVESLVDMPIESTQDSNSTEQVRDFIYEMY